MALLPEQAHLRSFLVLGCPRLSFRAMLGTHEGDPRQTDGVVGIREPAAGNYRLAPDGDRDPRV